MCAFFLQILVKLAETFINLFTKVSIMKIFLLHKDFITLFYVVIILL